MEQLVHSLWVFGMSVLYGFWIQSAYQSLLAIRVIIPRHKFFYWIEDLVFWQAAALITFQMFFETNFGEIRGYGIAGLLIGMIVSFFTVGALLKSVSHKIRQVYLKIKRKINKRRQKKREIKRAKKEMRQKIKEEKHEKDKKQGKGKERAKK